MAVPYHYQLVSTELQSLVLLDYYQSLMKVSFTTESHTYTFTECTFYSWNSHLEFLPTQTYSLWFDDLCLA